MIAAATSSGMTIASIVSRISALSVRIAVPVVRVQARQPIEQVVDRRRVRHDAPEGVRRHAEAGRHVDAVDPRELAQVGALAADDGDLRPVDLLEPQERGSSLFSAITSSPSVSPRWRPPWRRIGAARAPVAGLGHARTASILSTIKFIAPRPHLRAALKVAGGEGGWSPARAASTTVASPARRLAPDVPFDRDRGVVPGMPLIVAANRDERFARPAIPMTRLDGLGGPAIRGGRDEVGGGTSFASDEFGVVAGLTNRPLRDGPDAAKRSAVSCPSCSPHHPTAAAAVEAFGTAIDPGAYNPSWLLVADRNDAFFVDVTATDEVIVEHLQPGVHVLRTATSTSRPRRQSGCASCSIPP